MSEIVILLTTVQEEERAEVIARALVTERLAACVNVLPPMTSVYRWKGTVERDREQQVIMKTTADRVDVLEARVRALHPYEVPEFLVLHASGGSIAYLDWVRESVG